MTIRIFTAICMTLIVCILMGTLFIVSQDPLVYNIQPFTVDRKAYTSGDQMVITSYRCNNEGRPIVVQTNQRYFINMNTGERYDVPSAPGVIQKGCSWQDAKVFDGWARGMPSGVYIKRGVTVAEGRFRTVEVPWQTEPFIYTRTYVEE